jgi:hypothetical protein
MKINAEWHKKHRMPKSPTLEERLEWHREHSRHCACREMPPSLAMLLEMRSRGERAPANPSKRPATARRKTKKR